MIIFSLLDRSVWRKNYIYVRLVRCKNFFRTSIRNRNNFPFFITVLTMAAGRKERG